MPSRMCSLTSLRAALNHLYDPRFLQMSSLLEAMRQSGRPSSVVQLQRTLIEAIESVRQEAEQSDRQPLWRAYEILHYRYVQQCSQQEVADQLGVTVRHLKREQRRALEILGCRLSERYGIDIDLGADTEEDLSDQDDKGIPSTASDLRWLKEMPPSQPSRLSEIMPDVLGLVAPLASQHHVGLDVQDMGSLPDVAARSVAVRQILLSLLTSGIRHVPGGTLKVRAASQSWQVMVAVEGTTERPASGQSHADSDGLRLVRQMAEACAGSMEATVSSDGFRVVLSLPATAQVPVLVIDDNPEILGLFQRYATGTRYRIVTERNPGPIARLVSRVLPRVIVLDVMMPDVDGWELLGRLRQHPLTAHIPIVVCTILEQEELAVSLGVSAFLRKPVQRHEFLQTLDSLVTPAQVLHSAGE